MTIIVINLMAGYGGYDSKVTSPVKGVCSDHSGSFHSLDHRAVASSLSLRGQIECRRAGRYFFLDNVFKQIIYNITIIDNLHRFHILTNIVYKDKGAQWQIG